MGSVAALSDGETALGLSLAGIDAREVADPGEMERQADELAGDPGVRVVFLDEALFRRLPSPVRKRLEESRAPLFVPIPALRGGAEALSPEERIARLMRRAIGYQIRVRR